MRARYLLFAVVVVIATAFLCLRASRPASESNNMAPAASSPPAPGPTSVSTGEVRFVRGVRNQALTSVKSSTDPRVPAQRAAKNSYAGAPAVTSLSDSASKAARLVADFAAAARIPNFDPTVIAFQDFTNRQGAFSGTALSTRTHSASVRGIVETMTSYFDAERPLDPDERSHRQDRWYQCTGTWSEKEAVDETMAILERIGATRTIEAVRNGGRHTYEATAYDVKDPDGNTLHVTPFVTVTLYDRDSRPVATAQYRMGSNGPAGLTRWHHWPGNG